MKQNAPMIAIVDDDPAVLRALVRVLKAQSIATTTFSSGQLFLESLDHAIPDCLILDFQMPKMTGLDLLQRFGAQNIRIPTIVITAHDNAGVREQCMAAGAVAFLPKPISDSALVDAVALARGPLSR